MPNNPRIIIFRFGFRYLDKSKKKAVLAVLGTLSVVLGSKKRLFWFLVFVRFLQFS